MKKQWAVFIGRFSPWHNGHRKIALAALNDAESLIIIIGSAGSASNIKNPWTASEREAMIRSTFTLEQNERVSIAQSSDHYNNSLWLADVQYSMAEISNYAEDKDIGLVYCKTDFTSNYLDDFPQWERMTYSFNEPDCHATEIRNLYFTMDNAYKEHLHENVIVYLEAFRSTPAFKNFKDEFDFIGDYKESWRGAPFKPIFTTVDAVVVKSGHVLLVKRKGFPGRGLWALPGGFLNHEERIEDGMLRELKEETSIALSKVELRKAIVESKVFDDPLRSLRGRTLTHAYLLDLGTGALDRVKGSDDAERAKWLPIDKVLAISDQLFEDHHLIVSYFVNRL